MPRSGSVERRWALLYDVGWGPFLLGIHCWTGRSPDVEPRTATFRTRLLARQAAKSCCYPRARAVRVTLAIWKDGGR